MKNETITKILKLVQSNYEEIAVEFDLTRRRMTWPFLTQYCLKIFADDHILDVACGNGRLCQELKMHQKNYLGIDSSQSLINLARRNFPDYNFEEANFLDQNFLKTLKEKNNSFDKIFFLAALQHIPGQELRVKALQNIKYYLKPGGEMVMSNWNIWRSRHRHLIIKSAWHKIIGKNKLDFKDIIFPWQGQKESTRYYHAFTKNELFTLVKKANFTVSEYYQDAHNFWLILK